MVYHKLWHALHGTNDSRNLNNTQAREFDDEVENEGSSVRYLNVHCELIVEIDKDEDLDLAIEMGYWECDDVLETIADALSRGDFSELTEDQVENIRIRLE